MDYINIASNGEQLHFNATLLLSDSGEVAPCVRIGLLTLALVF